MFVAFLSVDCNRVRCAAPPSPDECDNIVQRDPDSGICCTHCGEYTHVHAHVWLLHSSSYVCTEVSFW